MITAPGSYRQEDQKCKVILRYAKKFMDSLGYMELCLKTKQIESKTSRQKVNEKNGGCLGPHSLGMVINLMVEAIQEIEYRAIF